MNYLHLLQYIRGTLSLNALLSYYPAQNSTTVAAAVAACKGTAIYV